MQNKVINYRVLSSVCYSLICGEKLYISQLRTTDFDDNERVIDLKVVDYDKLSTIKSTRQLQFQGEIF